MPNFRKILKEGFYSNLRVTIPPVTVPSWPCLFSGLTVEDLNKCTFTDPSFGIFSSNFWRDKSLFSINQIKSFCLNIPSSYPAWPINGEMVTGLLTPDLNNKMVYPKNLLSLINRNWIIDGKSISQIFNAFEIKKKLFLKKLKEDFELFVFVIRIPDGITHHSSIRLSKTNDYIREGYVKIDEFIGEILKKNDIDNIFLISDHGLKTYSHEFNIKRFMEKKKILFYNSYLLNKVLSLFIKIFGFLNPRFFNTTYFHNKVIKFFENLNFVDKKRELSDPNNSRFIHFYSNYGGIYLSDKDKSKKEYLKKILLKNKNIDRVIFYDSNSMPDIILVLKSKYLFSVKDSLSTINRAYSFNHSDKGLFAAIGKNIKKGKKNEIFYLNFAPTILKLFNIQKPFHMKGEALDILK